MKNLRQEILDSDFFIIAEVGLNHDGSLGDAFRLIEEAKKSGVNAIKFQLHISDEERTKLDPTPPHFKLEDRKEYYDRTAFTLKEWKKLCEYTHSLDIYFIVSPFSHKAVDILEELDIDAYKIASGETTNIPLLEYIDSKNKPVLLSTGMSNWKEIDNAVNALKQNLITLFQCSSQYPCLAENVGLNVIKELIERFKDITIGYSDHTLNNYSSIAAFLFGAKVFEKHFTLSKNLYSPDACLSVDPKEMLEYVNGLEFITKVLKNPVIKNNIEIYSEMKFRFEKSIVAARDLKQGHTLEYNDLTFKKPGNGIRADNYKKLIGKKLKKALIKDEKILLEYLNS
ncbi:MAG: N-acetylneuraminate synthase family protein [Promethearchaeota archaeon]